MNRISKIITKTRDLAFINEAKAIAGNNVDSFLSDNSWLIRKLHTGTFYLSINDRLMLDWSTIKITNKIISQLNEDSSHDIEVNNDTFIFLIKGIFKI